MIAEFSDETIPPATAFNKPRVLLFYVQRLLFRNSFEYIEPLGLMSLAAFLEEKGYEPGVYTGTLTEAFELLKTVFEKRPVAAVGLSCDFENQSAVESFSRKIKARWKIPVVIGGPQAFALDNTFISNSQCDAVVRGEGEITLWHLLDSLVLGKTGLDRIKGITYPGPDSRLIVNPDRELISDLDALPHQRTGHSLTQAKDNIAVLTGRGCPFKCAFCYQSSHSKVIRFRSVDNVMAEIRQTLQANTNAKYVWFADDTFTLNPDRVQEFCEKISHLRTERDFVWFCEGHPSTLVKWPHMVKQMVNAGLVRLQIGIESGSRSIIDSYGKKTTLEQIKETVRICKQANLPQLCGNIIIGGAHETQESLEETWTFVDSILQIAPGMLDISLTLFMPYPCTAITQNPEKFGLQIIDPQATMSIGDYPTVRTKELTREQISSARKAFSRRLINRMHTLLLDGEVPQELILQHYNLIERYGLSSVWYKAVYSSRAFLDRRFTLLSRTSAQRSQNIPRAELDYFHPLRVFNLYNSLSWKGELPTMEGIVLSPFEYELILLCSGKLELAKIKDKMFTRFGAAFESRQELSILVEKLVMEFENRHWMVFTPY